MPPTCVSLWELAGWFPKDVWLRVHFPFIILGGIIGERECGGERESVCVEEGLLACVRYIVSVFRFSDLFYINGSDPLKKKLEWTSDGHRHIITWASLQVCVCCQLIGGEVQDTIQVDLLNCFDKQYVRELLQPAVSLSNLLLPNQELLE